MLIYEAEGFLKVEADSIRQLCRSEDHVTFSDDKGIGFEVHAVLCKFQDDSRSRCSVAFHNKALKKALIFSVMSSDEDSAWQHAHDTLAGLGYRLQEVNLRLSPAMLEVVLRDIPGLATPAEALRHRDEKAQLLAYLQKIVETNPENAAGKKAARKLAAERRLNEQIKELRQLLVDILSPAQESATEGEPLMAQVEDLTARLGTAQSLADQERKQRELNESILEAAEKRIQELEEMLVEADKKSVGEMKQKRRIVVLKGQVKELEDRLQLTSDELLKERGKQEQFDAEVRQAQEQITTLEESLREAEKTLADSHDQLIKEQASKRQLETSCKDAEERIRQREEELRGQSVQSVRSEEAEQAVVELQTQLETLEGVLHDLREEHQRERALRESLEKCETEDSQRIKELEDELEQARGLNEEAARPNETQQSVVKVQAQLEMLESELYHLRNEQERERALRESLEESAVEDGKRIKELEGELDSARSEVSATAAEREDAYRDQIDALDGRLRELQAEKESLVRELEHAHKTNDSLQKMAADKAAEASAAEVEKFVELAAESEWLKKKLSQESGRHAAHNAEPADSKKTHSKKPLPHELRPEPNKAAFFHPNWDLEGLPCQSEEQVVRAWETVFNVQIALEGYPSQYCMAFLVVLRREKTKKLFMLFRLKQNRHTLVCVPAATPKNEEQLQKAIDEGLSFLKKSGFEMEEMPKEYIARSLGSYFLKE